MPRLILWLALAHALSDGASGWLLGTSAGRLPPETVAWMFLVYNALAFGAQPLAGLLVDRGRHLTLTASAGLAAVAAALLCAMDAPFAAAGLAGCGSAFFHVSGGGIALRLSGNRASAAGVFSAPGVIGLALGGLASTSPWPLAWPLVTMLIGVAAVVALSRPAIAHVATAPVGSGHVARSRVEFDRHDLLMLSLLAAIALRSFVWTLVQAIDAGDSSLLLVIALAAATGKACGGWAADHVGWRRWTLGALLCATPLLTFGGTHPVFLAAGVMLLQSTTPVMLAMAGQLLPGSPATAAGLALGLGVALGGVPVLLGVVPSTMVVGSWLVPLVLTAACALTIIAGRGHRRQRGEEAMRDPAVPHPVAVGVLSLLILFVAPVAEARADLLIPGSVPRVWCIGVANLDRFPETVVAGYGDFPHPALKPPAPGAIGQYSIQIDAGKPYCSAKPFTPYLFVVPRKNYRPVLPPNSTEVRRMAGAVEVALGLTFPEMPRGAKEILDVLELMPANGAQPTLRKRQVRYTFTNKTVEELPYGADGVRPPPSRVPPAPPAEASTLASTAAPKRTERQLLALDLIESPSPATPTGVAALLVLAGVALAVVIRRRRR